MEERSGTLRRAGCGDRASPSRSAACWRPPRSRAKKPKKQVRDTTTWLCKPGLPDNPCEPGFYTTTLISPVRPDRRAPSPSSQIKQAEVRLLLRLSRPSATTRAPNSDLSIDPEERSIALYQAARYSLHCRVFAPMYRQLTLQAILGGGSITPDAQQIAYGDVLAAWKTYLRKYNQGRGVVLIGHSQGTFVLRELIHQVDRPEARRCASAWSRRSCSAAT